MVIPEAGKVPVLLQWKVSPKFSKTRMRTSIFFPCVPVYVSVALARVRVMCTCPRWNWEFNPGCWVRFWNQNVFIRNHPPSYLSAQDGSTSRKKYSALIHVLVSRY